MERPPRLCSDMAIVTGAALDLGPPLSDSEPCDAGQYPVAVPPPAESLAILQQGIENRAMGLVAAAAKQVLERHTRATLGDRGPGRVRALLTVGKNHVGRDQEIRGSAERDPAAKLQVRGFRARADEIARVGVELPVVPVRPVGLPLDFVSQTETATEQPVAPGIRPDFDQPLSSNEEVSLRQGLVAHTEARLQRPVVDGQPARRICPE